MRKDQRNNISIEDANFIRTSLESGRKYGYPQCCIDAFVLQTPTYCKNNKPSASDRIRARASIMNGKPTGFYPCIKHAKMIIAGKIKLEDLIIKTPHRCLPFPDDCQFV